MDHYDFSSLTLLLKSQRPEEYTPSPQTIELQGINSATYSSRYETYQSMCEMLIQFFKHGRDIKQRN